MRSTNEVLIGRTGTTIAGSAEVSGPTGIPKCLGSR